MNTDIKRKLFDKLKEFYNDKEFVMGVISNVNNNDDIQAILDYINTGEDVSIENIILLSLHLGIEREKNSK